MNSFRQTVRKILPDAIRKPIGYMAGRFHAHFIQPIEGAIFDLTKGRFRADGCQFIIPKDQTSRSYRACFLNGSYEAEERELIREFIRPDDSVLELGACLGIVSCVTNKLLTNKSHHVVVEGNPFCVPSLHRNRELNQCGFLVVNCAVSNNREATFYIHPVYIVGGTTQRESSCPVRVPAHALAELDARYGPFSALIMDIEGAELEILQASIEILNRYRLVVVELHEWAIGARDVERCREILTRAGLRFQRRAGITEAWKRD